MTDWNVLNGNPAPGDPGRIQRVGVGECTRIADTANSARLELERIKDKFTSSIWMGETAAQFSKSLPTVIEDLRKLAQGYGNVADALQTYAVKLDYLQVESGSTLSKAQTAQADIAIQTNELAKAESYRTQMSSNRDSSVAQVRSRELAVQELGRQRLSLQNQRRSATDPPQIAALDLKISQNAQWFSAAQSAHRDAVNILINAERNLDDAVSGVKTISDRLSDGNARLEAARVNSQRIGDQHKTNAQRAASAIREAKGTAVGSTWDKVRHRIRESEAFKTIMFAVDEIANKLGLVSMVCNFLALVPGLNVVFGPVAAALALVAVVFAVTQFLMKEFEGKSTGWQRLANATVAALGVIGLKGNLSTFKQGWHTAGKLKTLTSAWNLGQKNATLGRDSLKQMNRTFKMLHSGTLLDAGTHRLKFTTFMKTVGQRPSTNSIKAVSGSNIIDAVVEVKFRPEMWLMPILERRL